MRRSFVAAAMLAVIAVPVQASRADAKRVQVSRVANDPQSLALARELIATIYPPNWETEYFDTMRAEALAEVEGEANIEERATLRNDMNRWLDNAVPVVKRHLPRISEAYVQAYAREFPAQELRQIVAFAKTPAGRHFLERSVSFGEDAGVAAAEAEMDRELAPLYDDFYKARCQRAAQTRLAAGDSEAKCSRA